MPVQSAIDSALNPAWGNTAQNVATIRVPAGTTIYESMKALLFHKADCLAEAVRFTFPWLIPAGLFIKLKVDRAGKRSNQAPTNSCRLHLSQAT